MVTWLFPLQLTKLLLVTCYESLDHLLMTSSHPLLHHDGV